MERIVELLEEIRDRQADALALQREQLDLVRAQAERAGRLQDRAESLQQTYADTLRRGRAFIFTVIAIIAGLLLYLGWLMFRLG